MNGMFHGLNAPSLAYLEIISVTAPARFYPQYSFVVTIGCFDVIDEVTPKNNPITFYPSVRVDNYDSIGGTADFSSAPWVAGTSTFDLTVIPTANDSGAFDIDIYLSNDTAPVSFKYRGYITTKTVPAV